MIILQFIYQQFTPAKLCGFLFKSYNLNTKKALFSKFLKHKRNKALKKCALKSKLIA